MLQTLWNTRFTMPPPHPLPHPHTGTYIVTLQAEWEYIQRPIPWVLLGRIACKAWEGGLLLPMFHGRCVSVCLLDTLVGHAKRLNQSRCRLWCELVGTHGSMHWMGPRSLRRKQHFWRTYTWESQACVWSIYLVYTTCCDAASRCHYCSNLLSLIFFLFLGLRCASFNSTTVTRFFATILWWNEAVYYRHSGPVLTDELVISPRTPHADEISIGSSVFVGLTVVTNKHTDHATPSVATGRIWLELRLGPELCGRTKSHAELNTANIRWRWSVGQSRSWQ